MSNNLLRTIIVTLMVLALLVAMVVRNNRRRIQAPRRHAPVSMSFPLPAHKHA